MTEREQSTGAEGGSVSEEAVGLVGSLAKNKREEIRLTVSNYKGFDLVGVRVWFKAQDGGMRPSKEGFNFRVELLPEFSGLVAKAMEVASAKGLLGNSPARLSTGAASGPPTAMGDIVKLLSTSDESGEAVPRGTPKLRPYVDGE